MTSESTNPAASATGSDSAHPLNIDEAMKLDFHDPDEDTVEGEDDPQSKIGKDEAEDGQSSDEIEAAEGDEQEVEATGEEETGEDEPESAPEPADDVHVTVNGERLALSELKSGYLRQADYSRKTQHVAETRKGLEALSARVNRSVEAIADFLVKQIPQAPDPQLAMTNPGEFVQKKALHEASVAQVNAILSQAGEVADVANTLTTEQRKEHLQAENARLAEAFPTTATDEGRKTFFDAASVAARELGYSDEEIGQVVDHRMFALAHYAAIGMKAEKAREKAKAKVVNAPPVAPQKQRQSANQAASRRNQEAMKRLARTGSMQDALLVDFE